MILKITLKDSQWKRNYYYDGVIVFVINWPPVHAVWPNYEVLEFQPWSVTAPDLGSVAFFNIVKYPDLPHPPVLMCKLPPREILSLALSTDITRFTSTQDHQPTCKSPVPIPAYRSHVNYTLGHLLPSCHIYRIPVDSTPLLIPKYLLTVPVFACLSPSATTTGVFSAPYYLNLYHVVLRLQLWAGGTPT